MVQQFLICILLVVISACTSRQGDGSTVKSTVGAIDSSATNHQPIQEVKSGYNDHFVTSTYDSPNLEDELTTHRKNLKELSDSGFFAAIHSKLLLSLAKKHQDYLKTKSNYQLVYFAKGSLFQNKGDDYAFIVYDRDNPRILILVFDKLADKYYLLFKDIRVANGLESADCAYGAFGTLDYQIAEELIYKKEYLIKKPGDVLESSVCKITHVSKDEDLIPEDGCFSKNISGDSSRNSLCIATSFVYNNWECMQYDKAKQVFAIFYGQAFAD